MNHWAINHWTSNRWTKIAGTTALSGLAIATGTIVGLLRGWHVPTMAPEELGAQLQPDFQIVIPEGNGPFPTVLAFHSCAGIRNHEWPRVLVEQGYATILVDSYTSRPELNKDIVCTGRAFWGAERAGDVWTSIELAHQLPFVDRDNLFLMGWSHGGWAIADLFALRSDNRLPTNLNRAPNIEIESAVSGAILMYPYCNFPAVSRRGWSLPVPTLMLLGSEDNVSRAEECLEIVERTNRRSSDRENAQTTAYVYEAGHVFDARYVRRRYDPEATADARERILDFLGAHGNKDVDGLEIAEVAN